MSEDKEDFQVDGVYRQDVDMDNNGIPDPQQPGYVDPNETPREDRIEFGEDVSSTSPYQRSHREGVAHLVATYDTSDHYSRDPDQRSRTEQANAEATVFETQLSSDPEKRSDNKSYRDALANLEINRLRARPPQKSTLRAELSRLRPPKDEPKSGIEIASEIWLGLSAGHKWAAQRKLEDQHKRDQMAADKLILERAVEEDVRRATEARDAAAGPAQGADPTGGTPGGGPAPDTPGPTGGTDGPGGPGGPGTPDGGATPPQAESAPTPAVPESGPSGSPEPAPANENERTAPAREVAASTDSPAATPPVVDPVGDPSSQKTAPQASEPIATGREVDPGRATGEAGLGMAASVVNPAAGVAVSAVQTHETQRQAGQDHQTDKATPTRAKGPSASAPAPTPERQTGAAEPGGRRLAMASAERPEGSNVVQFRRPVPARQGALTRQAESAPRPSSPVLSKGPATPPQRRVAGLGVSISSAILQASRGNQANEISLVELHQKQRDQSGRGM